MMENRATVLPPALLNCKPKRGWVLIKPDQRTNLTTGGIITETGEENMSALRTGLAVDVGGGVKMDSGDFTDPPCKNGDSVLFTDSAAAVVLIEDEQFMLVQNNSVFALATQAARRRIKTADLGDLMSLPEPANGAPRPIR